MLDNLGKYNQEKLLQRVEQLDAAVRAAGKQPRLRREEHAVQGALGGRVQPLHRHDRRVRHQIIEDLGVEDLHGPVVGARGHQRVPPGPRVEARRPERLVVVFQCPVRLLAQIHVVPAQT